MLNGSFQTGPGLQAQVLLWVKITSSRSVFQNGCTCVLAVWKHHITQEQHFPHVLLAWSIRPLERTAFAAHADAPAQQPYPLLKRSFDGGSVMRG